MRNQIYSFEKHSNLGYISEVSIRKDSFIGQFLINNSDQENIVNNDLYIYHEDIVNAYNIAIYQDNNIAEKILPLFKNKISGPKGELLKTYEEEVLDYILEHDDFHSLIDNEEIKTKVYVVFENGEYSKQKLSKKNKTKMK